MAAIKIHILSRHSWTICKSLTTLIIKNHIMWSELIVENVLAAILNLLNAIYMLIFGSLFFNINNLYKLYKKFFFLHPNGL